VVFQYGILRGLCLATGLWLTAVAAQAQPHRGPDMPIGRATAAPEGFLDFCRRRPAQCGLGSAASVTGRLGGRWAPTSTAASDLLEIERIDAQPLPAEVAFAASSSRKPSAAASMSLDLWSTLKSVNTLMNAAIQSREDALAYGRADHWETPIGASAPVGDCEDYVLEKRRALIDAGLDRRALNIAVVTTPWGELHAVLLVATSQGEYVLDNLTPWIRRWDQTDYVWRLRQLGGEAHSWARVRRLRPT
jgi:predicted transglutaminase-like cysteine proteinase